MSIEDIEYLKRNSVKESSIVFIDSAKRNRSQHRKPNYYKYSFDEPFRNVYSVELLESAIPRTMYQIDEFNDTLVFLTYDADNTTPQFDTITIDHREYHIHDLMEMINRKFAASSIVEMQALNIIPVSISETDTSKLFFSNSNAGTDANDAFYFLAFASNGAETLGFHEYSEGSHKDYTQITSSDAAIADIQAVVAYSGYIEQEIIDQTFKSGIGKGFADVSVNNHEVPSATYGTTQNIQTPGLVNLVGERFVRLRCPNIEAHMDSTMGAGANAIGLGLIKLGITGFADIRNDFYSVEKKEFHPIGKLTELEFRIENIDGNLYNFRGVNHTMLFNIKYYTPRPNADPSSPDYIKPDYTLNPNYNPNLLDYKKTQYEKDSSVDSEEEIKELANDFRKNFMEPEKKYDYSSDEDMMYMPDRSPVHYQDEPRYDSDMIEKRRSEERHNRRDNNLVESSGSSESESSGSESSGSESKLDQNDVNFDIRKFNQKYNTGLTPHHPLYRAEYQHP
jgi:hypothetical protein